MSYLRDLADQGWGDCTIYEVVEEFVKPLTAQTRESVAEYLLKDIKLKALVKRRADFFVSYAWSYTLNNIISALDSDNYKHAFIWFDAFVVNQHHKDKVDLDSFLHVFAGAIGEIGDLVMVVGPWESPTNVKRAWCVYEILCTVEAGHVEKRVAMPATEREALLRAAKSGQLSHAKFLQIFADVNVHRCEAKEQSDRDAILKLIDGRPEVNDAVMQPLKKFYRMLLESAAADATGKEADELYSALGNLYQSLGDLSLAEEWLRRALEATREAGVQGSTLGTRLNNLASCLWTQDSSSAEAARLGREALGIAERALGPKHPTTQQYRRDWG